MDELNYYINEIIIPTTNREILEMTLHKCGCSYFNSQQIFKNVYKITNIYPLLPLKTLNEFLVLPKKTIITLTVG